MLLIQATTPVWRPTPLARPGRRSRCPASPWPPAWCPEPGEHPAQSTLSGEAVRAEGREARHSLWHCRWRVNSAFPVREHNIYYERVYEDKVLQKYMQTIISSTWSSKRNLFYCPFKMTHQKLLNWMIRQNDS